MQILWLVLAVALIWASSSEAACTGSSPTWTSTPDHASVATCVTNAVAGDTINVSAGSATWASDLTITKNISLVGAGIGNTVITNNATNYLITYSPTSNAQLFRVSGFTFTLVNRRGILLNNNHLNPPIYKVRVDHNRFTNSTASRAAIFVAGCRGVIDNNIFDAMPYPLGLGWGDNNGNFGAWDWSTFPELVWGTPNDSIYLEDNVINDISTAVTDADEGGRYVIRYNSIGGSSENYPWHDIHGGRGALHGGFGGEVYGNTISQGGFLISHRGGRLAFYHNSAPNGGTYNLYNNDGCPPQTKERINNSYIFRNRQGLAGALIGWSNSGGDNCGGVVVLNTTFWIDTASFFNGTFGVGAGTLAARPTTCATGVGYWATNQSTTDLTGMVGPNPSTPISGTLYKCTSTNTWTSYYTPLAYPHPLRAGSPIDTVPGPPDPPQNLTVS